MSSKSFLILVFYKLVSYVKDKRIACFRSFKNLDIVISVSALTLQKFYFSLLKRYFKKWNIYVQNTSISFTVLSHANHIICAFVNIGSHEYNNVGRGVNIGCDRCFWTGFNIKFALILISRFIKLNQPRRDGGVWGRNSSFRN